MWWGAGGGHTLWGPKCPGSVSVSRFGLVVLLLKLSQWVLPRRSLKHRPGSVLFTIVLVSGRPSWKACCLLFVVVQSPSGRVCRSGVVHWSESRPNHFAGVKLPNHIFLLSTLNMFSVSPVFCDCWSVVWEGYNTALSLYHPFSFGTRLTRVCEIHLQASMKTSQFLFL